MATPTTSDNTMSHDEDLRSRLISSQTHILRAISKNDEDEVFDDLRYDDEIENIDFMIHKCQENIRNYTITKKLNDDTDQSLREVAAGMEATEEDLSAELTAVKKRLEKAKETLDYVLRTHYSDYHGEIRSILMELEKANGSDEEEDRYVKLSDEYHIVPILILQKAFCIVQHPTKEAFFRLVPLR